MASLALQRCLNHDLREAVSRCPSCHNFFCRECVVLFETRLLCASCLAVASSSEELPRSHPRFSLRSAVLVMLGLLAAWLLFYLAGWTLLQFRDYPPLAVLASSALRCAP
jgi:hypothetical protein